MKKVFRLTAMAVLVLGLATACKQKPAEPEEVIDTMPIVEEVVDTMPEEVVEEPVVEEPVVKKATKKKATPKNNDLTAKENNNSIAVQKVDNTVSLRDQSKMKENVASQKVENNNKLNVAQKK